MKAFDPSQGLLALTKVILVRIFDEEITELPDEYLEVLSGIVLHHLIFSLPERECVVLNRRFERAKTFRAIGDELGVSRERARQIALRAIYRLQGKAKADLVKTMQDIERKEQS